MWLKTYINEDRWDYLYEEETEKYHELKCTSAISKNRYRVHKTSYYRSIFNHFAPLSNDYEIGYYNGAIEKDKVQECVEYLWTIHAFNSHNQKVINIEITEKEDYFEVYTYSLALIYGDWDMQDIIDVYDNYIRFDKNSKLISFRKSLRKQIMTNR